MNARRTPPLSLHAAVALAFAGGPLTITLHGAPWDTRRAVTAGDWHGDLGDWLEAVEAHARTLTPTPAPSPLPPWAGDLYHRAHRVAMLATAGGRGPITLSRSARGLVANTDPRTCSPDLWIAALCEAAMRPSFPGPGWEPGPFELAARVTA